MSNIYPSQHPLVAHKLTRLRDKNTQPKKFRELTREIAALLTYEATADLKLSPRKVETPLIGLYRDEQTLQPVEYYNKLPIAPTVSVCLILDPMLATGGSAVATVDIVKRWGVNRIKIIAMIASPKGIAAIQEAHHDVPIHLAAIDEKLNDIGYILPGLGDAGDRQFGTA